MCRPTFRPAPASSQSELCVPRNAPWELLLIEATPFTVTIPGGHVQAYDLRRGRRGCLGPLGPGFPLPLTPAGAVDFWKCLQTTVQDTHRTNRAYFSP